MPQSDWESQIPPSLAKLFEGFGEIQEAAALEKKIAAISEAGAGLLPPSEQKKLKVDDVFAEAAGDGKVRNVYELFNMSDEADRLRCTLLLNDPAYIPAQRSIEWGRGPSGESVLYYFIGFTVQIATYEKWLAAKTPKAPADSPVAEEPAPKLETGPVAEHLPKTGWAGRVKLRMLSPLGR